jgi:hypothetical protein
MFRASVKGSEQVSVKAFFVWLQPAGLQVNRGSNACNHLLSPEIKLPILNASVALHSMGRTGRLVVNFAWRVGCSPVFRSLGGQILKH